MRFQRLAFASGWVVAAVVLLLAAAGPNEVRTRRLVIEDEKGRDRIVLEVAPLSPAFNGEYPVIRLTDREGKSRASFGLQPRDDEGNEAYLSLYRFRASK